MKNDEDEYMGAYPSDTKIIKGWAIWIAAFLIVVSVITFIGSRMVRTADNGVAHYEEFTTLYQTCQRINTDLCNLNELPATDRQFEQFSKTQQVFTLRKQLNRWVEDYNAKSRMINRSLWKSDDLPYQLSLDQFTCH